jgi:alpha-beta hydrolase superfamily lysophospholipase
MKKQDFKLKGIPAVLWGDKSDKIFIAVHGNMSNKTDNIIAEFAKTASEYGYQVLSFDLPEHGDRKNENIPCKVQNCVKDLTEIINYVKESSKKISLFACSMGAYFSLLAYKEEKLDQSLFLSPVVNMEKIIENMMLWSGVSKERLEKEKEIMTPMGQMLYWDYYCYVKSHPVSEWHSPTAILYGSKDEICEFSEVSRFSEKFNCNFQIMDNGEHYFHTEEQIKFFTDWVNKLIIK